MSWKYWASTFVVAMVISINSATAQADDPKVAVLVPVAELPPYHLFQDSKRFTIMEWPKSKLREDVSETITNFDQIKGKTSRHYKLKPNEPIYKNDVAEPEEDRNNLQPGQVAHALLLPFEMAAAGFLIPGNRVNIEATITPMAPGGLVKTINILEDIEVLAVDVYSSKDPAGTERKSARLLLRLSRGQSLVLKNYQDTAKVDVVRRRLGDPVHVPPSFGFSPRILAPLAVQTTPEQQVLNQWLGNWQSSYKKPKAEWTPKELTGTAEQSYTRTTGGPFVQEDSLHSDTITNSSIITYDVEKKCYRAWWFSSTGQTDESTGTWDAGKRTMTWKSKGEPATVTVVSQHFVDNDNIEWNVETKDKAGKLLFQIEGKSTRLKQLNK